MLSPALRVLRRILPGTALEAATTVEVAATIQAVVQMSLPRMVRGFVRSANRVGLAIDAQNSDDVYISLFEAATWLDTLDERCKLRGHSRDVQAVLFVRQRTHHNWAAAASPPVPGSGQAEWEWRPFENIPLNPKRRDEDLERAYRERLERKPVMEVFERLRPMIEALAPDTDVS